MPPKGDARKTKVGGGADGGKDSALGTGGNGNEGSAAGATGNGGNDSAPPNSDSASSAAGTPMEVDPNASAQEKVRHWTKEVEKVYYKYGDQLMQTAQEALEKVQGVDERTIKAVTSQWNAVRKGHQTRLNHCLDKLEEVVPDDFELALELEQSREPAHPGVRPVPFRDFVQTARTDVVEAIGDLVQWLRASTHDPADIQSLATVKQAACTDRCDKALSKMSDDILARMQAAGTAQLEFGRDSDYGQALEAQQSLARERDDLQLQLEAFESQVEALKASETDLHSQRKELLEKLTQAQADLKASNEKFSRAQADLVASRDKLGILDTVTDFLETDANNAMDTLAQDDSARIADLEARLQAIREANVKLQRRVADQQKQISAGAGAKQSVVDRARDIGFVIDASGKLQLGPPASQVFDTSKPYCYASREDKVGFAEFLRMYKHRYDSAEEDVKVNMLGEYLEGEPKRVYRSVLSSWDEGSSITFGELEFRMRDLMQDNSRTGVLLKQQRVHNLHKRDDESYLSFITFLETKVCEAFEDASLDTVDGVKIQVLLKNIRDPVLALQVEQALRGVPMGSPLFPTAKDAAITYERTAILAGQWNGGGPNRNNGKGPSRGKYQGNTSAPAKSDGKSAGLVIERQRVLRKRLLR